MCFKLLGYTGIIIGDYNNHVHVHVTVVVKYIQVTVNTHSWVGSDHITVNPMLL